MFGLVVVLAAGSGCDQSLGDYFVIPGFPGFEVGNARIMNASPDLGQVDVWNRLFPFWRDLSLGDLSAFSAINDGERNLRVVMAGAETDETAIAERILKFPENTFSSVILAGPSGALSFILIEESESPVEEGAIGVRVVHAFNGVGDVELMDGDAALIDPIGYPAQSALVRVTDVNALTIQPAGGGEPLWTANADDFTSGRNYTVVVYPANADSSAVAVRVIEEMPAMQE